jgi:hypothetical protein
MMTIYKRPKTFLLQTTGSSNGFNFILASFKPLMWVVVRVLTPPAGGGVSLTYIMKEASKLHLQK